MFGVLAHRLLTLATAGILVMAGQWTWLALQAPSPPAVRRMPSSPPAAVSPDKASIVERFAEQFRSRGAAMGSVGALSGLVPSAAPTARSSVLYVGAGEVRSEVRLNGSTLGHTPYLGHVRCGPKSRLKIELIPKEGAPRTYVSGCRPEIRIETE